MGDKKELPASCQLHEERLENLEQSLTTIIDNVDVILKRGNDFTIPVINGRTEYRKASELLGEMYVGLKKLENKLDQEVADLKKETPKSLFSNFAVFSDNAFKIIMLIALAITMIKTFGH